MLLNRLAYDSHGTPTKVEHAVKGVKYYCPDCEKQLVFKNSGKTGPGSRCPHFAHVDNSNCTNESILHAMFKIEAAKYLNAQIQAGNQIIVEWRCPHCGKMQNGNLLTKAASVEVEKGIPNCRPDISIKDKDGKVIVAVEVVVTHGPEPPTLASYKDSGIIMFQYNVSIDDLDCIPEKLAAPDAVNFCTSRQCENWNIKCCRRVISQGSATCRQCKTPVETFSLTLETAIGAIPGSKEDLTSLQQDLAHEKKQTVIGSIRQDGKEEMVLRTLCRCRQAPYSSNNGGQFRFLPGRGFVRKNRLN